MTTTDDLTSSISSIDPSDSDDEQEQFYALQRDVDGPRTLAVRQPNRVDRDVIPEVHAAMITEAEAAIVVENSTRDLKELFSDVQARLKEDGKQGKNIDNVVEGMKSGMENLTQLTDDHTSKLNIHADQIGGNTDKIEVKQSCREMEEHTANIKNFVDESARELLEELRKVIELIQPDSVASTPDGFDKVSNQKSAHVCVKTDELGTVEINKLGKRMTGNEKQIIEVIESCREEFDEHIKKMENFVEESARKMREELRRSH